MRDKKGVLHLNNGILLQSKQYDSKSHLDRSHVRHLNQGNPMVTDLGVIEPYVTSRYMEKPFLYGFSNMKSSRIEVKDNIYKWSYPLADEPCYIVEDLSLHSKPGIAGETFRIKVNQHKYSQGTILAVDPQSPEQLIITPDEPEYDGDGVIYTVMYVGIDPANRWFPKAYLAPGTKLFDLGTEANEYTKAYSSIPTTTGGIREYMNFVGETTSQIHYEITRDAAYKVTNTNMVAPLDAHREVIEMYRFRPGSTAHDLSLKGQTPQKMLNAYKVKYGSKAQKQLKEDIVQRLWVPRIEQLGHAYVEASVEAKALFSAGGISSYDSKSKSNRALGLFHQLNMGNQYNINPRFFTVEKLENILAERLRHVAEPFANSLETTITVGRGMYALLRNQLNKRPREAGAVIQAQDVLKGLGKDNRHLTYDPLQVDSWVMSNGYGVVHMKIHPGLDPHDANDLINPMVTVAKSVGAHRLSSYMIIVDDITNSDGGNICELVPKHGFDMQQRVVVGKLNYLGSPNYGGVFHSAGNHPGYEMYIEKRDKAYFVKDITKSLLIKPINERTGRPIYDGFFK